MTNTVSFPGLGLEFTVNRVAFSIGPLTITWYGLLIAAGILLAMCFAFYQCKKFGIIADKLMDAALGGVVGGIIANHTGENISHFAGELIAPIVAQGDPVGAVIICAKEQNPNFGPMEHVVAETAAGFLAKQMEQ